MTMPLDDLLRSMAQAKGSDLHFKAGRPPLVRLNGDLRAFQCPPWSGEDILNALTPVMSERAKTAFEQTNEADLSYACPGVGRFRINMFRQRGQPGAVLRLIPAKTPTIEAMGLPLVLNTIADNVNGLVLVTGPTGSGKSTTLAAMIQHINTTRPVHILTIEDPIEFTYEDQKACINQRELGNDTETLQKALRAALRQDPDILLMGEMRDQETINFGITAAETGHLVFATLHTNDAPQTIERIMDILPAEAKTAVRIQLSALLRGIVCQRLVKRADGSGRVAALEILVMSGTIQQLVAEGKLATIPKAMEEGEFYKMQTFNQALYNLAKEGTITEETALASTSQPDGLRLMFKGVVRGSGAAGSGGDAKKEDAETSKADRITF